MNDIYDQLLTVVDFQQVYNNEKNIVICVTVFCEVCDQAIVEKLRSLNIILYWFSRSPYYKHSYSTNHNDSNEKKTLNWYVNDDIQRYYSIDNNYLESNIPDIIRLLKAERIIISHYTSRDQLEVLLLTLSHF